MSWILDGFRKLLHSETAIKVALITGFGTLIAAWLNARPAVQKERLRLRRSERRSQQFDHAAKRAQFWDTWLKAIGTLGTDADKTAWQETAKHHLLQSSYEMEIVVLGHDKRVNAFRSRKEVQRRNQERLKSFPFWRKLLLLYKPEDQSHEAMFTWFHWSALICLMSGLFLFAIDPHYEISSYKAKINATNADSALSTDTRKGKLAKIEADHAESTMERDLMPYTCLLSGLAAYSSFLSAQYAERGDEEYRE